MVVLPLTNFLDLITSLAYYICYVIDLENERTYFRVI